MAVIFVLHFDSGAGSRGVEDHEVGGHGKQMGRGTDFDVVPGDFFVAAREVEIGGESGGFFVELEDVAAGIIDEDVAVARRIELPVVGVEEGEASIGRRVESEFQEILFAHAGMSQVLNGGGTGRVEHRLDFGAEAAVPLEAWKGVEGLIPGFPVAADLTADGAGPGESDLGLDGVQRLPFGRLGFAGRAPGGFIGYEAGHVRDVRQIYPAGALEFGLVVGCAKEQE